MKIKFETLILLSLLIFLVYSIIATTGFVFNKYRNKWTGYQFITPLYAPGSKAQIGIKIMKFETLQDLRNFLKEYE